MEKKININISGLAIVVLIILVAVLGYYLLKPHIPSISIDNSKCEARIANLTHLNNDLAIQYAALQVKDSANKLTIAKQTVVIVTLRREKDLAVAAAHQLSKDSANAFIIGEYGIAADKDSVNLPGDIASDIVADKVELTYLRQLVPNLDQQITNLVQSEDNKDKMIANLQARTFASDTIINDQKVVIRHLKTQRILIAGSSIVLIVVIAML